MGTARPLFKVDHAMTDQEKIRSLQKRLVVERRLRVQAETNATRFHALMLQARVAALPPRRTP